ncbi:MAG: SelB C-terminal domain-containing protein, partial [Actinomycetota bacterium]
EPRLTVAQQSARVALLDRLDAEGASPAPLGEVAEAVGADDDLLTVLRSTGQLVDLPGLDAAMTASALERATATLAALQADRGPFTASQAREALDTTRRFALPLLELLDTTGVTTRDGDLRHLT